MLADYCHIQTFSSKDLYMDRLSPLASRGPRVAVYSLDDEAWACAVIRILAPLRAEGWDIIWAAKTNGSSMSCDVESARGADLAIIQRLFPSKSTEGVLRAL